MDKTNINFWYAHDLLLSTSYNFFRGHEWCKHGTCAKDFYNEQAYFQKTMNLYKKYNMTKILQEQGIIPSDVTMYEVSLVDYYLTC